MRLTLLLVASFLLGCAPKALPPKPPHPKCLGGFSTGLHCQAAR